MEITCKEWGVLQDGRTVQLYSMVNRSGSSVSISTYGGIITSIIMPDRTGKMEDIVLGYDSLEEYVSDDGYLGAMIGRYANRIAGASFSMGGTLWNLTKNQGENTLHGGSGFHKKLWIANVSSERLVLSYHSPHGEDGFPGNLDVSLSFVLSEDNCFSIETEAISDRDTVCSITNHTYFNLAAKGDIFSNLFQIFSENYTPCSSSLIPDGSICSVEGTPYDFRQQRHLTEKKLDVNYVIPSGQSICAKVVEPKSGRVLAVMSDLPAMQFYAGGGLKLRRGKGKNLYGPNSGFCMEPQHFPNSPNTPEFPSCTLKKGERYRHTIQFRFLVET